MSKSERKQSACSALGDAQSRKKEDSSGKMSLCRACLVLLDTENAAYDLYREKDLAAKFIGCMGATNGLRFLGAPLDMESSPKIVLKYICECCYQLVQKFYNFQRMCEESYRNFEKLMAEVNSNSKDIIYNQDEEYPEVIERLLEIKMEENVLSQAQSVPLESIDDIEEVYIMEDDNDKQILGKENITVKTPFGIAKRPRGLRHRIHCNICNQGFYKMPIYEAHMQVHQGKQPYKCTFDWCKKSFSRANVLTTHLRKVHQNIRSTYACSEPNCNKVYMALSSLNYHVKRQHTKDIKPSKPAAKHVCDKCGKSYGRLAHLTRHQWVHRSKREFNFVCNKCDKPFYTNENLKDHMVRQHSKKKLWRCKQCVRIFFSRLSLTRHMSKHIRMSRALPKSQAD